MRIPQLKKILDGVVYEIESFNPDALVTIDFPDFNFKVAQRVQASDKTKAKLIHYVAPSVWAWRPKRAEKVASFLDAMICTLPFEPEYFKKHKLRSVYVGNPVIEDHPEAADGNRFRKDQGIGPDEKVLGLCFGSRISEMKNLSQVMIEATEYLRERYPDLSIVCPTLPNLEFDTLKLIQDVNAKKFVLHDHEKKWDGLKACDFAITVSGTMALELAYADIPHLVVYKTNPMTYAIAKSMVKIKYAHLGNIILDEPAIQEYIQGRCRSEAVALEAIKHFEDPARGDEQRAKFEIIRDKLKVEKDIKPSLKAARYIQYIVQGGKKK